MDKAARKSYKKLKAAHLADYQPLFARVELDLDAEQPDYTTDTFNIKVTGFAVQASTFADYNDAQPELMKLVNSKTSADAQF